MEIDPQAKECVEEFEHFLDELPFDEAVEAVRGLRRYQEEVIAERDILIGWEQYVDTDSDD